MRLTTKGRFAVIAMIDLALHQAQGAVALANISERQNISLSYLEQLFGRLRKNELVESRRGPGGGYRLRYSLNQISVADIIKAVDEPLDTTQCGTGECIEANSKGICLTHRLWENLNYKILEYLTSVTLYDLVNQESSQHLAKTIPIIETPKTPPKKIKTRDKPMKNVPVINSIFSLGQVSFGDQND
jgi:Rrf2 family transcriptional regulator, iron-sulfur cluster assembly transcription factor